MNKVILMGRLTRDPEVRYTDGPEPMAIAKFTLAVDRKFKREGEQSADFISCTAFGRTGEFIERYCHQGTKLVIEGRIQTGSYTNKDGNRVFTTDVVVESCEFAESKASSGSSTNSRANSNSNSNANSNYNNQSGMSVDADGFMNIPDGVDDEGLPFA